MILSRKKHYNLQFLSFFFFFTALSRLTSYNFNVEATRPDSPNLGTQDTYPSHRVATARLCRLPISACVIPTSYYLGLSRWPSSATCSQSKSTGATRYQDMLNLHDGYVHYWLRFQSRCLWPMDVFLSAYPPQSNLKGRSGSGDRLFCFFDVTIGRPCQ